MNINEIIEEEDEDKNNINILKNNSIIENEEKENKKTNNIKRIKDEKRLKNISKINSSLSNKSLNKKEIINIKPINEKSEANNEVKNENKSYLINYNNSPFSARDKILQNSKNKEPIELPLLHNNKNKSPEINKILTKNSLKPFNGNESLSTCAFSNSTKRNIKNIYLTEHMSKFRIGLSSANSLSNNNNEPIIPILSIERPFSNLNCGGGIQLWKIDDIKNKQEDNINKIDFEIENKTNKNYSQKKYDNHLSQKIPTRNKNIVQNFDVKEKTTNSLKYKNNIDKINNKNNNIMPKLHKIKIVKEAFKNNNINIYNKQLFENKNSSNDMLNNKIFHIRNRNKSLS